jgi:hypothetical protein
MVTNVCSITIQEAEEGGLPVQGHCELHSKFQLTLATKWDPVSRGTKRSNQYVVELEILGSSYPLFCLSKVHIEQVTFHPKLRQNEKEVGKSPVQSAQLFLSLTWNRRGTLTRRRRVAKRKPFAVDITSKASTHINPGELSSQWPTLGKIKLRRKKAPETNFPGSPRLG